MGIVCGALRKIVPVLAGSNLSIGLPWPCLLEARMTQGTCLQREMNSSEGSGFAPTMCEHRAPQSFF